jgi:hypothetical protein
MGFKNVLYAGGIEDYNLNWEKNMLKKSVGNPLR